MYAQVLCRIVMHMKVLNGLNGSFEPFNRWQFNDALRECILVSLLSRGKAVVDV